MGLCKDGIQSDGAMIPGNRFCMSLHGTQGIAAVEPGLAQFAVQTNGVLKAGQGRIVLALLM